MAPAVSPGRSLYNRLRLWRAVRRAIAPRAPWRSHPSRRVPAAFGCHSHQVQGAHGSRRRHGEGRMQLEFLETFVEVARHGNVTRAAEGLYLSQPSVSSRLQALEAELGEQLLVRTPRGVRLTDAGREFLPYAERAVQAFRGGQEALSGLLEARAGRLAL